MKSPLSQDPNPQSVLHPSYVSVLDKAGIIESGIFSIVAMGIELTKSSL